MSNRNGQPDLPDLNVTGANESGHRLVDSDGAVFGMNSDPGGMPSPNRGRNNVSIRRSNEDLDTIHLINEQAVLPFTNLDSTVETNEALRALDAGINASMRSPIRIRNSSGAERPLFGRNTGTLMSPEKDHGTHKSRVLQPPRQPSTPAGHISEETVSRSSTLQRAPRPDPNSFSHAECGAEDEPSALPASRASEAEEYSANPRPPIKATHGVLGPIRAPSSQRSGGGGAARTTTNRSNSRSRINHIQNMQNKKYTFSRDTETESNLENKTIQSNENFISNTFDRVSKLQANRKKKSKKPNKNSDSYASRAEYQSQKPSQRMNQSSLLEDGSSESYNSFPSRSSYRSERDFYVRINEEQKNELQKNVQKVYDLELKEVKRTMKDEAEKVRLELQLVKSNMEIQRLQEAENIRLQSEKTKSLNLQRQIQDLRKENSEQLHPSRNSMNQTVLNPKSKSEIVNPLSPIGERSTPSTPEQQTVIENRQLNSTENIDRLDDNKNGRKEIQKMYDQLSEIGCANKHDPAKMAQANQKIYQQKVRRGTASQFVKNQLQRRALTDHERDVASLERPRDEVPLDAYRSLNNRRHKSTIVEDSSSFASMNTPSRPKPDRSRSMKHKRTRNKSSRKRISEKSKKSKRKQRHRSSSSTSSSTIEEESTCPRKHSSRRSRRPASFDSSSDSSSDSSETLTESEPERRSTRDSNRKKSRAESRSSCHRSTRNSSSHKNASSRRTRDRDSTPSRGSRHSKDQSRRSRRDRSRRPHVTIASTSSEGETIRSRRSHAKHTKERAKAKRSKATNESVLLEAINLIKTIKDDSEKTNKTLYEESVKTLLEESVKKDKKPFRKSQKKFILDAWDPRLTQYDFMQKGDGNSLPTILFGEIESKIENNDYNEEEIIFLISLVFKQRIRGQAEAKEIIERSKEFTDSKGVKHTRDFLKTVDRTQLYLNLIDEFLGTRDFRIFPMRETEHLNDLYFKVMLSINLAKYSEAKSEVNKKLDAIERIIHPNAGLIPNKSLRDRLVYHLDIKGVIEDLQEGKDIDIKKILKQVQRTHDRDNRVSQCTSVNINLMQKSVEQAPQVVNAVLYQGELNNPQKPQGQEGSGFSKFPKQGNQKPNGQGYVPRDINKHLSSNNDNKSGDNPDRRQSRKPEIKKDPSSGTLFVGNVPWATTPEDLQTEFSKFGDVSEARIVKDRNTGKSRGFAYVSFKGDNAPAIVKKAIETEITLADRKLRLDYASQRRTPVTTTSTPGEPEGRPNASGTTGGQLNEIKTIHQALNLINIDSQRAYVDEDGTRRAAIGLGVTGIRVTCVFPGGRTSEAQLDTCCFPDGAINERLINKLGLRAYLKEEITPIIAAGNKKFNANQVLECPVQVGDDHTSVKMVVCETGSENTLLLGLPMLRYFGIINNMEQTCKELDKKLKEAGYKLPGGHSETSTENKSLRDIDSFPDDFDFSLYKVTWSDLYLFIRKHYPLDYKFKEPVNWALGSKDLCKVMSNYFETNWNKSSLGPIRGKFKIGEWSKRSQENGSKFLSMLVEEQDLYINEVFKFAAEIDAEEIGMLGPANVAGLNSIIAHPQYAERRSESSWMWIEEELKAHNRSYDEGIQAIEKASQIRWETKITETEPDDQKPTARKNGPWNAVDETENPKKLKPILKPGSKFSYEKAVLHREDIVEPDKVDGLDLKRKLVNPRFRKAQIEYERRASDKKAAEQLKISVAELNQKAPHLFRDEPSKDKEPRAEWETRLKIEGAEFRRSYGERRYEKEITKDLPYPNILDRYSDEYNTVTTAMKFNRENRRKEKLIHFLKIYQETAVKMPAKIITPREKKANDPDRKSFTSASENTFSVKEKAHSVGDKDSSVRDRAPSVRDEGTPIKLNKDQPGQPESGSAGTSPDTSQMEKEPAPSQDPKSMKEPKKAKSKKNLEVQKTPPRRSSRIRKSVDPKLDSITGQRTDAPLVPQISPTPISERQEIMCPVGLESPRSAKARAGQRDLDRTKNFRDLEGAPLQKIGKFQEIIRIKKKHHLNEHNMNRDNSQEWFKNLIQKKGNERLKIEERRMAVGAAQLGFEIYYKKVRKKMI